MSKHTPGPWTTRLATDGSGDIGILGGGGCLAECFHAIRSGKEYARDEQWANARLIAAAPLLLEALRMFWHAQHADVDQDVYTAAIRAADAAIIAATREAK